MASNMIGNLAVNLTMETAAFQRGATIAEKRAQAMQTRMQGIGASVKGIGAGLAAGFATAGAGALVSNAFQIASSMQEAADATGVTIEQLQRLRVAASQNGASADQMDASLTKLSAKLGELQQGSAQAVSAFAAIGLSVDDLKGKNPAEAFALIVEKISAIKDPTLQAALAKDVLGKSYGQLLPLIKAGTAALDEATNISKRNGELTKEQAEKLAYLADKWEEVKTRVGVSIAGAIADSASFLDHIRSYTDPMNKWVADTDAALYKMASGAEKWFNDMHESAYNSLVTGVSASFNTVVTSAQKLYNGVKTWLVDKLAAQFAWITKKIEALGQSFYQLYDDVVGHSYVPDMVIAVNQWFAKMEKGMTGSTTKATSKVSKEMEAMMTNVGSILNRLFPEASAIRAIEADMLALNTAFASKDKLISVEMYRAAMSKLQKQLEEAKETAHQVSLPPLNGFGDNDNMADIAPALSEVNKKIAQFGFAANDNADDIESSNVRIVKSYGDMARDVLGSISSLAKSIKGGDILGIIEGVLGVFTTLGSAGAFGSKIQTNLNLPARAKGGPVSSGKAYMVGEKGPELFTSNRSGYITSNKNMSSGGRAVSLSIVPSPYFNAVVDGRADGRVTLASPSIATAAAQGVQTNLQQSGFRALP